MAYSRLQSKIRKIVGQLRKPPVDSASTTTNASLRALTAAALALPGMSDHTAQAADGDSVSFEYGHYEEGDRNLFGLKSKFSPIQVDSVHGSGTLTFWDRVKFSFNYLQDTWSGATPVATLPQAWQGNNVVRDFINNTVSEATPFVQRPAVFLDANFNPLETRLDENGFEIVDPITFEPIYFRNQQLVHTLSNASPETRKQGDFKLGYEWDDAAFTTGFGISSENDYESRWVNGLGRADFNQKTTSVSAGVSYTGSDTKATLDHDTEPYTDTDAFNDQIDRIDIPGPGGIVSQRTILNGKRHDWSAQLGLSQVLTKNLFFETSLGYTRSTGYMENPYKVVQVIFIDPDDTQPLPVGTAYRGEVRALLEQRPDVRNQWTVGTRFTQYIEPLDAATHLGYRYFSDDWGIDAHTFEADWVQPLFWGWTVTPKVRYYSQSEADFYAPFVVTQQAFTNTVDGTLPWDPKLLPENYSSDHRLSGYGALSGGLTLSKAFAKGITMEAGFEYYKHAGGLKLGGGGENSFADFDYWLFNAALKVDLDAPLLLDDHDHQHHKGHAGHTGHGRTPAGVMFDHMLPRAGDFMVGYRYMYSRNASDMLRGSTPIGNQAIVDTGCGAVPCRVAPAEMSMHMHMLDMMYAPTDWLNVMVMPQFMDMGMTMRHLEEAPAAPTGTPPHHYLAHSTGGISDTWLAALFKLFDVSGQHMHVSLGFSAPTGDVDITLRPMHREPQVELLHYGMQLGSGTWDFIPSLTYTGSVDRWAWGAQVSGTKRMEDRNKSGYQLGDRIQATGWGSVGLTDWLALSVRGVYTTQDTIEGEFEGQVGHRNRQGPVDFPFNYGGRFWDVGFGLNATIPGGALRGHELSVEWLQPVMDDFNGVQLERQGALSATWKIMF